MSNKYLFRGKKQCVIDKSQSQYSEQYLQKITRTYIRIMRGGKPIYKRRSRAGRKLFRGTPSTRHKRSQSTRKDSRFRYAQTRRQSLYSNSQKLFYIRTITFPTDLKAIMSITAIRGITESNTERMNLLWDIIISMEQRTFGGFAKYDWQSSEECTDILVIYILRSVSLGTIT